MRALQGFRALLWKEVKYFTIPFVMILFIYGWLAVVLHFTIEPHAILSHVKKVYYLFPGLLMFSLWDESRTRTDSQLFAIPTARYKLLLAKTVVVVLMCFAAFVLNRSCWFFFTDHFAPARPLQEGIRYWLRIRDALIELLYIIEMLSSALLAIGVGAYFKRIRWPVTVAVFVGLYNFHILSRVGSRLNVLGWWLKKWELTHSRFGMSIALPFVQESIHASTVAVMADMIVVSAILTVIGLYLYNRYAEV